MATSFSVILFIAAILMLVIMLWRRGRRPKRHPPGPFIFPVIGNIPQLFLNMDKPISEIVQKWREKYGNILMTEFGAVRIIWISGLKLCREVLQNKGKKFDCRPNWMTIIKETRQNEGILYNSGETYRQLRSLLYHAAVTNQHLETRIHEEMATLLANIERMSLEGKAVQLESVVRSSFMNLLYGIIFGHSLDAEKLAVWVDLMHDIKMANQVLDVTDIVPRLPFWSFRKKNSKLHDKLMQLRGAMKEEIRAHKKTFNLHKPADLIDLYIEVKLQGTDLSASHMNVQERCRNEISKTIGKVNMVTIQDMVHLPYTRATLYEVLRLKGNPITYPHATFKDVKLGNFIIPKHTIVFVNLASIHLDQELWDRPHDFYPDRFLDSSGHLKHRDHFYPYGLGIRKCTLQQTSERMLCLFFANIIRRFNIELSPEMEHIDLSGEQDAFHLPVRPKTFHLKITKIPN